MKLLLKVLLLFTLALSLSSWIAINPYVSGSSSSSSSPVSLIETDNTRTGNGTTHADFNNAFIGSAAADRVVCVAVAWFDTNASVDDFEIDGSDATHIVSTNINGAKARINCRAVASGTTADISVDFDANLDDNVSIGVFRLSGTGGSTANVDEEEETASSDNQIEFNNITVPTDGAALYVVAGANDNSNSWNNANEAYDHDLGASRGSAAISSTAGSYNVKADSTNNVARAGVAAAWSPP